MINKKKLIELFEDRVSHSTYEEEYIEGNYFPKIIFSSTLEDRKRTSLSEIEERSMFKVSSYSDCMMAIYRKNDMYFISFNSIETPITFPEFRRLKKIFLNFKEEHLQYCKNVKNILDTQLLNKVFKVKSKKETRIIVIEKVKVKNVEYEYEEDEAKDNGG